MEFFWQKVVEKIKKAPWATLKPYKPTYQKIPAKFNTIPKKKNGRQS